MDCDAKFRPFPNDTTIACELGQHVPGNFHRGTLRDYAYPGSETVMQWQEEDRRTFHGEWPGACTRHKECVLPLGHQGNCA